MIIECVGIAEYNPPNNPSLLQPALDPLHFPFSSVLQYIQAPSSTPTPPSTNTYIHTNTPTLNLRLLPEDADSRSAHWPLPPPFASLKGFGITSAEGILSFDKTPFFTALPPLHQMDSSVLLERTSARTGERLACGSLSFHLAGWLGSW